MSTMVHTFQILKFCLSLVIDLHKCQNNPLYVLILHTMERTIKYISSLNILELLINSQCFIDVDMPSNWPSRTIKSSVSHHCAYKSACIVKYTSSKHIVILTRVPMMFHKSSHSCHWPSQMPTKSTKSPYYAYKSACTIKYSSSKHIVILTGVPTMFHKISHSCHLSQP